MSVYFRLQSTRGATPSNHSFLHTTFHFNPRAHTGRDGSRNDYTFYRVISIHAPAWGATRVVYRTMLAMAISIHTPRMGARLLLSLRIYRAIPFQSTRPAWGRDVFAKQAPPQQQISIHTPRMGARHPFLMLTTGTLAFQSTRPAWGRDPRKRLPGTRHQISIHTPRMGARPASRVKGIGLDAFQSTRPAWGRDLCIVCDLAWYNHFNPHAPHGGATRSFGNGAAAKEISIHTPRMGARPGSAIPNSSSGAFQSTRPAWGRDR